MYSASALISAPRPEVIPRLTPEVIAAKTLKATVSFDMVIFVSLTNFYKLKLGQRLKAKNYR